MTSIERVAKASKCYFAFLCVFCFTNLNKWQDMLDDVVTGAVCKKHEADTSSLAGIPVVFVVILLLLG